MIRAAVSTQQKPDLVPLPRERDRALPRGGVLGKFYEAESYSIQPRHHARSKDGKTGRRKELVPAAAEILINRGVELEPNEWSVSAMLTHCRRHPERFTPEIQKAIDSKFLASVSRGGFSVQNAHSFIEKELLPILTREFGLQKGKDPYHQVPIALGLTDGYYMNFGHSLITVLQEDGKYRTYNPVKQPGLDELIAVMDPEQYYLENTHYRTGALQLGIGRVATYVALVCPWRLNDEQRREFPNPEVLTRSVIDDLEGLREMHRKGNALFQLWGVKTRLGRWVSRMVRGTEYVGNCAYSSTKPLERAGLIESSTASPVRGIIELKKKWGDAIVILRTERVAHSSPPGTGDRNPALDTSFLSALYRKVDPNYRDEFHPEKHIDAIAYCADVPGPERYDLRIRLPHEPKVGDKSTTATASRQ